MTTDPSRPKTVWQLAQDTDQPLATVIFQAVAYDAWQSGGMIAAEWVDSLSSILHGRSPWRRPGAPAGVPVTNALTAAEPAAEFARRVLHDLGSPVLVGAPEIADAAERAELGVRNGETFTGHADEAARWASLAKGEITLDELVPGTG